MADIEVVIKIPEEVYEGLVYLDIFQVRNLIQKGTLLPKGHGDLKDFDKIEWYGCDFEDGKTCIKNRGNCDVCTFVYAPLPQYHEFGEKIEPTTKNCESCRYYGSHHEVCNYCYECSLWTDGETTTKNDLGVDCISRVKVIDYLCKHCPDDGECFKDCDEIKYLRQMSSVTPQEPRKGHWINYDYDEDKYDKIKCSECGHIFIVDSYHWCDIGFTKDDLKYCPNCGAKMVEPQESEGKE